MILKNESDGLLLRATVQSYQNQEEDWPPLAMPLLVAP